MFFSVIVPIYKVEKYLPTCIESVLNQTFSDFELILVDDGSTDSCPAICDGYAEKDSRIKVVHKKNGGLVSARQAGAEVCQGEYVFNLDGDDSIAPDALQSAYEIIKETNADIVSFSYSEIKDSQIGKKVDDVLPEGLYEKEDIINKIYPVLLCDENMLSAFYFIWGRAIKRELVRPVQLSVSTEVSHGEDVCCVVPCFLKAERVYFSRKSVYFYTVRGDSLSTSFKAKQITDISNTIKHLCKYKSDAPSDFEGQISRYSCYMCFAILALAAEGNHFGHIKEIKELINNSVHKEEIPKARFKNITVKSRISVFLMQRGLFTAAFYFLNLCKKIKVVLKKG